MKKNNYYRILGACNSTTYYIKYEDLIDYKINTSWYIKGFDYFDGNLKLSNSFLRYEEVDFYVIVDYLPIRHPDIRKNKIKNLLNI